MRGLVTDGEWLYGATWEGEGEWEWERSEK